MPVAGQFAGYLKSAREKAGLTQAVLAEKCGLTGSYISLLESGKKPAPSDQVVRRMASVLDLATGEALQIAHFDRAPADLQRAVDHLRRQAMLERHLRDLTVEALFPLSLWNVIPGSLSRRMKAAMGPDLDGEVIRAIDHLQDVARTSPDLPTFRRETTEVLGRLPEEKRRKILEAAPVLAEAAAAGDPARLLPAPGPGFPPDVLPGDFLVVDASLSPAAGDLVLVETEGKIALRRFEPGAAGVRGVVVEVRRRLRK